MMAAPHTPALSVVIPTFNRCELLRRALEVLSTTQRFPVDDFEVIVSDDGSTDATAAVVRSFEGRLRLRYHAQEDRGFRPGTARNAGARLAAAPVIAFLDTGALPGPDYVRGHVAAHAAGADRAIIGYAYGYNLNNPFPELDAELARRGPAEVVRRMAGRRDLEDSRHPHYARVDFDLSRLALPWFMLWSVNFSVPADRFRAIGGFDEEFVDWGVEDLELGYRLAGAGLDLVLSREAWVVEVPHARDNDRNLASSMRNARLFLRKHPDPAVELLCAWSAGNIHEPLEDTYQGLLRWVRRARRRDVAAEVGAARADAPRQPGRKPRVMVIGCGGAPPPLPDETTYVLVDFDAEMLAAADPDGRHTHHHAVGAFLAEADKSADLVVVTSRLAGLWDRYGGYVVAEADRIGRAVSVPFLDRQPAGAVAS